MQTSSNYGLKLFEGTDNVKRQDFVDNFSMIDTQLKSINDNSYPDVTATGTNAYAGTSDRIKALGKGTKLTLFVGTDATGDCTLNLNAYGAKNIKDGFGSIVTNLKANIPYNLCYNGTDFILQGKGGGGDALASQLLINKKATVDTGPIVGTMPDNGGVLSTLTNNNQEYTIPAGFHNGLGKIKAMITNLAAVVIKAGTTAGGIVGTFTSDATAAAADIINGKTAYVNGNKIIGNATIESLGGFHVISSSISPSFSGNGSVTITTPGPPIAVFGIYRRDTTTWPFTYSVTGDFGIPIYDIYIPYLGISISGNTITFSGTVSINKINWVAIYK